MTGIPPPSRVRPQDRGIRPTGIDFSTIGFPGQDIPTSWWQNIVAGINFPEELTAVIAGKIFTDSPRFDQSLGNFHRQVGFHSLGLEAGLPALVAAGLGLGAALLNPFDPLNIGAIGRLTKVGATLDATRAAVRAEETGKGLLKTSKIGGKDVMQWDKKALKKRLTETKKEAADLKSVTNRTPEQVRTFRAARRNVKADGKLLEELPARNQILKDLQIRRGMSREELLETPSLAQQLRSGERSLLGVVSPLSARNIPFKTLRGFQATARPLVGGRFGAGLVEGFGTVAGGASSTTRSAFNAVVRKLRGDRDPRPAVLSARSGQALQELEEIALSNVGNQDAFAREANRWQRKFPDLGKAEHRRIIDELESRNAIVQGNLRVLNDLLDQTPYDELTKQMVDKVVKVPEGNMATGKQLTPGEELRYSPSRLSQPEMETAVTRWSASKAPALRMSKGHTYRFDQDFITVRLNGSSKLGRMSEEELGKIFHDQSMANVAGVPNYRVVVRGKDKFLVARNMPSAGSFDNARVRNTHVENLGNISAGLGKLRRMIGGTGNAPNQPLPILVSPFAGVQVLDPEIFLKTDSTPAVALRQSKALIEQLVREHVPSINPDLISLPMLDSVGAARKVGKGAKKYIMEPSPTDEFLDLSEGGTKHIDTLALVDIAADTGFIRQLLRGQTPDQSTLAAFQKANRIDEERAVIQAAQAEGKAPKFAPIVIQKSPDGRVFIAEGKARLAAAAIEDAPTVPVYVKPYLGEFVEPTGDYYNSYRLRGYDVLDQAHTSPAVKEVIKEVASQSGKARAVAGDVPDVGSIQTRIGHFSQERDEIIAEISELTGREPIDDLQIFANESRLEQVDAEIAKLQKVLDETPPPKAGTDEPGLLPRLQGILDEDYRMLNQAGESMSVSLRNLGPQSPASLAARDELLEAFRRLTVARQGPSKRTIEAQWDALRRDLISAYGNLDGATLRLAELGASARSGDEFTQLLLKDMQEQGVKRTAFPAAFRGAAAQDKFATLSASAERQLDSLAERGVFTTNSLTPGRAAEASRSRQAAILFAEGNNFRITDVNKSTEDLQQFAKEYTKSIVDPADVHNYDNLVMHSAEGQSSVRFEQLVEGVHPRMFAIARPPSKLKFSEAEKIRLAGINIFHINPEGQLDELAPYQNVLGLVKADTKSMVFFRTRSGDMFVKTGALPKEDSVATMANDLLGEAVEAIRIQEWGYILDNKIVLNNPIGGLMDKLNNANLKVLEKQLRKMAQQFTGMGFNKEMLFEVLTPFSQEHWAHIYTAYIRNPTLGDVAGKNFRLRLPKALEYLANTSTNINLATPTGSIRIRRDKLSKGVRELVKWQQKNLDEAVLSEVEAGHPAGWKANYYPRFMPQDTLDTLEKMYSNAIAKNPKLRRAVNSSDRFKDRKWSALTTNEIQDLYRTGKTDSKEIYKSMDSTRQAEQILAIRKMLPDGIEFFYTDTILATAERRMEAFSLESIGRTTDRLAVMDDAGVLLLGSSKRKNALTHRNKEIEKVKRQLNEEDRLIAELEGKKEALGVSDAERDTFRAIEKSIDKAKERQKKLALREDKLVEESVDDHIIAGRIPENPDTVWLAGPAARELQQRGLLDQSNMVDNPGSDMVRVRFSKALQKLTEDNSVDIFYTTPEGAELISRVFKTQTNPNGFLKWWDKMTSLFKQTTLFPMPQFHIRNTLSDAWLMWIGRGGDLVSMQESFSHMRTQWRYSRGKVSKEEAYSAMQNEITSSATGQRLTMEQLWNAGLGQGIAKGRFVVNDFVSSVENAGVMQEMIRVARKGGNEEASRLARGFRVPGTWVQETRETWQRFGVFLSEWKKTGDVQAAGLKVKEIFYDYSSLTSLEKSVLKRLIPFYSWSRFNIPRMIKTIATEPVFHAKTQAFIRNLQFSGDGQPIDERLLPEWAKKMGALVIGKNPDGSWIVKSLSGLLPVYDLYPALYQSPLEFGRDALSPLLKVPFEQLFNETVFSGAPIEQVPGQLARSGTLAHLGATRRAPVAQGALADAPLSFINYIWNEKNMNDLFRFGKQTIQLFDWVTGQPDFRGKKTPTFWAGLSELTIGRVIDIDPRMAGLMAARNDSALIRKYERLAVSAEQEGNIVARNALAARLNQLRLLAPPKN